MVVRGAFGQAATQELPSNLRFIMSTDHGRTVEELREYTQGDKFLLTNGTFAHGVDKVTPTTLAAYQYEIDRSQINSQDIVVFVNSNKSMELINQKLDMNSIDQASRSMSLGQALALQFPNFRVTIGFYDEETPRELYKALIGAGFNYEIYKYGYGIPENANEPPPEIVGAEDALHVSAFPMPGKLSSNLSLANPENPYCFTITDKRAQKGIEIVDLTKIVGPHGRPYLSEEGRALIPLAQGLETFGETWTQYGRRQVKAFQRVIGMPA